MSRSGACARSQEGNRNSADQVSMLDRLASPGSRSKCRTGASSRLWPRTGFRQLPAVTLAVTLDPFRRVATCLRAVYIQILNFMREVS